MSLPFCPDDPSQDLGKCHVLGGAGFHCADKYGRTRKNGRRDDFRMPRKIQSLAFQVGMYACIYTCILRSWGTPGGLAAFIFDNVHYVHDI